MTDARSIAIQVATFIVPFVVAIAVWQLVTMAFDITNLPSPLELGERVVDLMGTDVLWQNTWASLQRMAVGYVLGVIVGVAIGSILGVSKVMSDMFTPMLSLLIAIPTIAWVPILLMTMGLGSETVITAVFLGGFFSVAYSTMHGIRLVPTDYVNAFRIAGGKRLGSFRHVLLPGSLPTLLPGLRLAIGYSWRALVGAEMLAALVKYGLGKMIYTARFWNDVELMFIGLIIIGLLGLVMDRLILGTLERRTIERWGMVRSK